MTKLTLISWSLLVCLCSSAPFDATTSGPITTKAPFVKLSCKGHNPNGFFVDDKDPHKFHECVNGEHIADFTCPGALIFDESKQVCVDRSGPPPTRGPELTCPEPTGLFPYPGNKHKFLECTEGRPFVFDCPANLVFDPVTKNCIFDNGVTDGPTSAPNTSPPPTTPHTSGPQTSPTSGPTGGPTSASTSHPQTQPTTQSSGNVDCSKDGYFADPSNKHQYIICSKGHKTVMSCPSGMSYNEALEMCQ